MRHTTPDDIADAKPAAAADAGRVTPMMAQYVEIQ
eukprot:gene21978-27983_t